MKRWASLCLLVLPLCVNAQQKKPAERSLLWQVTGKNLKKPSYLFGTFHLLCKDQVNFSDELKEKLSKSDEVYFEVDMSDIKSMFQSMSSMNMKDGKQLKDLLTEAEYKKVDSTLKADTKVSLAFFSKMKPYLVSALFYTKFMKCSQQSGIDMELVEIAKKEHKKINGLETLEYQASIFDSIPYEEQAKELVQMADSIATMEVTFNKMVDVYLSQDLEQIAKMSDETDVSGAKYKDLLLTNRNKNWVKQLKQLMPEKSLFVAVGAGHLSGEDGLISLLRKAGYTVTPLKNSIPKKN